jgi:putative ABC transport system permease protein
MCDLYLEYYRLPVLDYAADAGLYALAAAVGLAAAALGSGVALRRVLRLHPAEALSPPPPPAFKLGAGPLEWLARGFDPLTRVVLRRALGYPRRALTTVLGISAALVLMVLAGQAPAAISQLLELSFGEAKRQDLSLSLVERLGPEALHALQRLPGVQQVEPFLAAEAVFSHAGRRVGEAVFGLVEQPRFERLIDVERRPLTMRGDGLILTAALARQLGARAGDLIHVQLTSGRQRSFVARVVATPEVTIGSSAYMELDALGRLIGEPGRISGAHLRVDPRQRAAFDRAVRQTPAVVGVSDVVAARVSMRRMFDEGSGVMSTLFTTFAVLMAGGAAYATSSVTLAEQRRDLATLQVLGFGRREASYVLLAEMALLGLCALPIGLIGGHVFAQAFLRAMATDVFTFPSVFEPALYVRAAAVVLLALAVAALLVRRGVDRIALVDSLKSRE